MTSFISFCIFLARGRTGFFTTRAGAGFILLYSGTGSGRTHLFLLVRKIKMRTCRLYEYGDIRGFRLGWSLAGPPLMTVCFYAFDDILIDTGQSHMRREAVGIAERYGIRRVFLTHHHEDHSGNARAIRTHCHAGVFAHELAVQKLKQAYPILFYQKYVWGRTQPLDLEPFPETIDTASGPLFPVHCPGHAKDHTVFLLRDRGVLFSGDLYLADRIKFFRIDEDIHTQIQSLKKVMTLDFDMLLCGHFPKASGGKQRIASKLAFLEDFYGQAARFHDQGYREKEIFRRMGLKENYPIKYFCFGNVSMRNGVRSVIRHRKAAGGQAAQ